MSRSTTFASLALATTLLAGCATGATAARPDDRDDAVHAHAASHREARRGAVLSVQRVQRLTAARTRAALTEDSFDASRVRHGVDAYRVVYRTVDPRGRATRASGLVVLPRTGQRRLRAVTYTHGTMAGRGSAPSVDTGGRSAEGLTLGGAGYAAVLPDYLGLGVGPGTHPYMHLSSEVTATLDLIQAADTVVRDQGRSLDPRLLVTGFSQGGVVAMAVARAVQRGHADGFRLAAASGISGPYDLTGQELPAALDGRLDGPSAAFCLAYLTIAYDRLYGLYDDPAEVFAAPYDRTVAPLFDGRHDEPEIFAQLPTSPDRLFTPNWAERLRHPSGRLRAALEANQTACRGWRPAPVRLYAARGDEQVVAANSRSCRDQLASDGVRAALVDTGDLRHFASGVEGFARTLAWFERLASPSGRR